MARAQQLVSCEAKVRSGGNRLEKVRRFPLAQVVTFRKSEGIEARSALSGARCSRGFREIVATRRFRFLV